MTFRSVLHLRCRRPFVLLWAVTLAACGGSSGASPLPALTLTSLTPSSLPVSLPRDVEIRGTGFSGGDLALEVLGVTSFPCTVIDDGLSSCRVPASSLPAGPHRARLLRGAAASNEIDLHVNPQPVLMAATPGVLDANGADTVFLSGSGFLEPLTVLIEFAEDSAPLETTPAVVQADGTEILCPIPALPMPGETFAGSLQVRNGDGQLAEAPLQVTFWREWRTID
ncbi:MAG: hypothetical protein ACYTG6_04570, partial [Planctomycetota bacterium]